jgi:transposase
MANRIKMAAEQAIVLLWQQGWSYRRIARELGLHRETVRQHVAAERAKPATPTLGSEGAERPDGGDPALAAAGQDGPKPANATLGNPSVPSACEAFREVIQAKLEQGLSAQRVWQDLVAEHAFRATYSSVKRFVRRLGEASPLPFRRMECEPGAEAQVDFGTGAPVGEPGRRRRRSHVLRMVLSHSRKGYSEAVFRQTTEAFLRAIENGFRTWGGVPRTLVIDQLRAAVAKPDWFDPELNPKVADFCRHYGTVMLPTRPRTPRHKGKVEAGVDYVQENGLKGHAFLTLAGENEHLAAWESRVADHRIHGTTRQQVHQVFEQAERAVLLALPPDLFPAFEEARRAVHRDGHVEVDKAYYSVPPEYLGHEVWVRWDARVVRVFDLRMNQIAIHVKADPGRFSTQPGHIASEKISAVERGSAWLLRRAAHIGPHTAAWAEALLEARGIEGVRVLQGLLSLARKHPADTLEKACESALSHQIFRLRGLRGLLRQPTHQAEFLEEHPLIRPLEQYGRLVPVSFRTEEEQEKDEEALMVLEAARGAVKREDPEGARAFPAGRPPDPALGPSPAEATARGALSCAPAPESLANPAAPVNEKGEVRHE